MPRMFFRRHNSDFSLSVDISIVHRVFEKKRVRRENICVFMLEENGKVYRNVWSIPCGTFALFVVNPT